MTDVIGHQAQFIKRKLFEEYGLYNLNYSIVADYEFFLRAVIQHKATTLHLPVIISEFDLSGLSSHPDQVKKINEENKLLFFN